MSIKKEESLLLFVDVKDILNQKIKLENTKSYDSIETKRKQVGDNIINNAWVLYNNIINNKIDDEIDNRFHPIEDIECNIDNENEIIIFKTISDRKTITDFLKYVNIKRGNVIYANLELKEILNNITRDYFEKQQQTTTKTINFKGHKPKTYVLKRLELVGTELNSYDSVIFTKNELNQIIVNVLDKPDERTSKTYYDCMIDYAKQNDGVIVGMHEIKFNMRGFSDTVKRIMNEKSEKYAN